MSGVDNPPEPTSQKSSKKKKKNKKKANGKAEDNSKAAEVNGAKDSAAQDEDDDEGDDDEGVAQQSTDAVAADDQGESTAPSTNPDTSTTVEPIALTSEQEQSAQFAHKVVQDLEALQPPSAQKPDTSDASNSEVSSDTAARLDAMQQERDTLRAEVTQLRQQLESLQKAREDDEETSLLRTELDQSRRDKEHAESQYRTLLGKVNTIRSQLTERLKADAEELDSARGRIDELESANTAAREENERLHESISTLNDDLKAQTTEAESLRSRANLSTSNWSKERDDLQAREAYLREEYDVAKQAMQDWEILATEERSRREMLEERSQELEEQLNGQREAYERVKNEADTQSNTVDGLQRALRDLQDERKRELREMVEQSQTQLDELRKQARSAEDVATDLKQQLESTQKELERALPYEKEVREKNLHIGKLRHEAVILNDHLTKALRFLKRGKPEDNVDRQLVTNHLLQFLALDRSDPKKFQVLQLIAALLGWSEEQREQAGLLRQGSITGTGSLKLPVSPFRRTPSTPSLSADFMPESPLSTSKESLAELWSEFLEREAQAGEGRSRKGSQTTTIRSPSLTTVSSPLAARSEAGYPFPGESSKLQRKESSTSGS